MPQSKPPASVYIGVCGGLPRIYTYEGKVDAKANENEDDENLNDDENKGV